MLLGEVMWSSGNVDVGVKWVPGRSPTLLSLGLCEWPEYLIAREIDLIMRTMNPMTRVIIIMTMPSA